MTNEKKKVSRARPGKKRAQVNIRISPDLKKAVVKEAKEKGETVTDILTALIEKAFA